MFFTSLYALVVNTGFTLSMPLNTIGAVAELAASDASEAMKSYFLFMGDSQVRTYLPAYPVRGYSSTEMSLEPETSVHDLVPDSLYLNVSGPRLSSFMTVMVATIFLLVHLGSSTLSGSVTG